MPLFFAYGTLYSPRRPENESDTFFGYGGRYKLFGKEGSAEHGAIDLCVEGGKPLDGKPVLAAGDTTPPRPRDADPTGPYRPGYELVAEQILQLIAELQLQPGDRMPTE